jgi:hypothetical protein
MGNYPISDNGFGDRGAGPVEADAIVVHLKITMGHERGAIVTGNSSSGCGQQFCVQAGTV